MKIGIPPTEEMRRIENNSEFRLSSVFMGIAKLIESTVFQLQSVHEEAGN